MKEIRRRSTCPISSALDVFGDKWTLLVMRDLLLRGKSHYREFLASDEGIATNILADRLARLEQAGIVKKTSDDPRSGRQAYIPTRKGSDLIPILLEMMLWSARHDPGADVHPALVAALDQDRDAVIAGIVDAGSLEGAVAQY